ncbi:MAG TPA: TorF family putative porin [Hyphomicrobiales bacterium]|nr:TorF family putative porin [Hyphomicrobiales bacterium]
MKRLAWILALAVAAPPAAFAADLGESAPSPVVAPAPASSPFDIGFGAKLMSDYNFRGITQSDHGPSGGAYVEPRYGWFYAGVAAWAVKLPTQPTAEVDLYGGIRPTWGQFSADIGAIYYWYPRELPGTNTDFWEVYAKPSWSVTDWATIGANVYYTPSFAQSGANGTYVSGTLKFNLPSVLPSKDIGWYTSGEFGHYFLGRTKAALGATNLPDYDFWNVGLAFTYKAFTLDFRYYDTDLSKRQCFMIAGNGAGPRSSWCGAAFIASLSIDTSLSALK